MADTPDDGGYEAYHPEQPSVSSSHTGDNFAGADDESDDYDPSNFVAAASQSTAASAPPIVDSLEQTVEPVKSSATGSEPPAKEQKPALLAIGGAVKHPRTVGGFVVDEDDDEEGETTGLNGSLGTTSSPKAAQAADNAFSTSELPIEKATQDAGLAAPVNVSSVVAPPFSTSHRSPLASNASASGTPLNFSAESSFPLPKARLPQDRVGILEDRIADDPRGDIDAWLNLISELHSRNKLDDARAVYERFFKIFPSAAEQWIAYANMELENDEFYRMEQIFTRSLPSIPNVQLWSLYLNYIRRRNNLTMDTTGNARQIITQAYEFVLANIGIDKDSGFIWQEYLRFLKSGPGTVGGNTWQDGQKMDTLRKKYQAAVRIPTQSIQSLWTEYSLFENSLNKVTGRQMLSQNTPSFMTAKQAFVALNTITSKLDRTTLPRLPPLEGYDGYEQFMEQVELWKKWIQFEKDDPLVLKESVKRDEQEEWLKRVIYAYKQAVMALRFWPETWYDAAEFCYANGMEKEGDDFLSKGIDANPESCLLAFKRADRLETTSNDESDPRKRGSMVRAPYDALLKTLYGLRETIEGRAEKSIAQIHANFAEQTQEEDQRDEDEDDEVRNDAAKERKQAMEDEIKAVQSQLNNQVETIKKTISATWIALMRAMRRIQGKGNPPKGDGSKEPGYGFRGAFAEGRTHMGQQTSDFFIEAGLMEHYIYHDPAGTRILEKGVKLFPDDENMALAFMKHLIDKDDVTNARASFQSVIAHFTKKSENNNKAKQLFFFFHDYESRFGDLSQIKRLEDRMAELYPEDPKLQLFASRWQSAKADGSKFSPTSARFIISPAVQTKKAEKQPPSDVGGVQRTTSTIEGVVASAVNSPRPASLQVSNSPKRAYQADESDTDIQQGPPRKFQRGESPLKGAAGRRLAAAAAGRTVSNLAGGATTPTPLPRDLAFLLSILPKSSLSGHLAGKLDVNKLVTVMSGVDVSRPPPATISVIQTQAQAPVPRPLSSVHPPLPQPLQSPVGATGYASQQSSVQRPGTGYQQYAPAATAAAAAAPPPQPQQQPPVAQYGGYGTPLPPSTGAPYQGYTPAQPPAQYSSYPPAQPPPAQYPPPPPTQQSGYTPQGYYQGYR